MRTEVHITRIGVLCTLLLLLACRHGDHKQTGEETHNAVKVSAADAPIQRFSQISGPPYFGGLALDTKTGQLCRTWAWGNKAGNDIAFSTPICSDLYDVDHDPFTAMAHDHGAISIRPFPPEDGVNGLIVVRAPNGKQFYFLDMQHADAFKKDAGIK